jgi:L-histidine Nalpha-methyltransferase
MRRQDFARSATSEILAGLGQEQKTLPAKLFYDEAGCALFEQITMLPEYYVTRAEMALLEAHAAAVAESAPLGAALVEYGAADEKKAVKLLDSDGADFSAYLPIDIEASILDALAARMRISHPDLPVIPHVADFAAPLSLHESIPGRQGFGFFPGSTFGNFEPEGAIGFLRSARATLAATGRDEPSFLAVGTDLPKPAEILLPAYDDAAGVTAAFNRNILLHVNRLSDANFDPDAFEHQARWNAEDSRIEMHLMSRTRQVAHVAGQTIRLRRGETIHTENSYKLAPQSFINLAREAGWQPVGFWTDPEGLFGLHLLRAEPSPADHDASSC